METENENTNLCCVLIDLEFTGLDNFIVSDNEIIQVKMINIKNKKSIIRNFNSKKELSAYTQLQHRAIRYDDCPYFTLDELVDMISKIEASIDFDFWGFGIEQDRKMLAKYGWQIPINDIRANFQKTQFAYRMATEGSGLESTYLIVTNEYPPNVSHSDFSEMTLINTLYEKMLHSDVKINMSVVPFGYYSGMSINEYVKNNRRQADGYRFNNHDEFSMSLTNAIEELMYEDDFEEDDY